MTTLPSTVQERIALPAVAATSTAPTPGELLGIIRRRAVLIAVLFFFFGGLAGGGFYTWWTYFPKYKSTGLIELITNQPQSELSVETGRLPEREQDRFLTTQSYVVKSPEILNSVVQDDDVRKTKWYTAIPSWKQPLLVLTDELVSAPLRGTSFLSISMSTRHSGDPKKIVETVMEKYRESVLDKAIEPYRDRQKKGTDRLTDLTDALNSKRNEMKDFASKLQGGVLARGWSTISQQGLLYAQSVTQLQIQMAAIGQLRNYYKAGGELTAEDQAAVEADPYVQTLRARVFNYEEERSALSKRLGPRHATIQKLDDNINSARASLLAAMTEATDQRQRVITEAAETAYQNTYTQFLKATNELKGLEAEQKEDDRLLFEFQVVQGDVTRLEEETAAMQTYVDELERVIADKSALTMRIAQQPVEPLARSEPSILMLPVLVLLALMLSVGIGVGVEVLDTSVRTSQDVARFVQMPLLGVVPDADDEELAIEHVELAMLSTPHSMMAEAFRHIRANLQYSAPAARQRSIIVTSPGPDDGKTTVACNLAIAAAQGGRRVLLVDANLRRPRLQEHWAGIEDKGLTTLLIGEGQLGDLVAHTSVPNLDVLGSGPMTPNPAELLGSEAFLAFLNDAAQRYDQVILDTSPVLIASDPTVLATLVDGVVMVLRARANSRGAARRACGLLQSVSAHIFGIVLNAAQVTRGGYFREQLRTYYDYQPDRPGRGSPKSLPK